MQTMITVGEKYLSIADFLTYVKATAEPDYSLSAATEQVFSLVDTIEVCEGGDETHCGAFIEIGPCVYRADVYRQLLYNTVAADRWHEQIVWEDFPDEFVVDGIMEALEEILYDLHVILKEKGW